MSTNLSASQYLCLTICAYRNPSLTEEEYYDYMTQTHAPLVKPLMEKYGIIRFTMVCKPLILHIPPCIPAVVLLVLRPQNIVLMTKSRPIMFQKREL